MNWKHFRLISSCLPIAFLKFRIAKHKHAKTMRNVWERMYERKFCSREKIICWIWNWEKKIPPSFLFALRVFPSKENYKTRRTITTIVSILVDLQLFRSKSKEAPWKLEEFLTQKKNFNSRLVLVHEKYQSFHKVHFFATKKEKFSKIRKEQNKIG